MVSIYGRTLSTVIHLKLLTKIQKKRAETVPVVSPVDLKDHIQPYQHQLQGTAVCLHAEKTEFGGLILI